MKRVKKINSFLSVLWGALVVFSTFLCLTTNALVFAQEQNKNGGLTIEIDPREYTGYGCNNEIVLQDASRGNIINFELENISGFGCGSSCGASREEGYSSTYASGCKNWQVMPIISPIFKYWIDESTLSSLTETQKNEFINNVDNAAAEWNSVRIADYTGAIVNLQKQSSDGVDVVPVKYDPSLSGVLGEFNPIPGFHEIKIKNYNGYTTILHEFGHMIGLQDLDMNNSVYTHISLMGYKKDGLLHYQDIQGLAVANGKHSSHDFRRYWYDGTHYNYVCYFCDVTDSVTELQGNTLHLEEAATCVHQYEKLVSAANRDWFKCYKCYKVIESDYIVNVKQDLTIELCEMIDLPDASLTIPDKIGGQSVTSIGPNLFINQKQLIDVIMPNSIFNIGSGAFMGCDNLNSVKLSGKITNIGANTFSGCTSLTSINIPANVTSIGDGAFAGCSSLTNITIPAGVTSIGEGAFAGCSNLNISVNTSNPNYSAQGNILYNKAKTKIIGSGDVSANITIPNTVTEVGVSAFSGNTNLQRVDIYGTPVIDDFAFYDCANLDEVYFYSYTVPEIRDGAFSDNIFTVYVPYNKQSTYYTIFSGYTDNIDSIPITVTLKKDGVAYQTIDTYYGADISGVTDPYKEGYTFNYWVDGAGNTYQNGDVWDSTVDLIVEADWTARQFHITFSGYGSEDLDAKPVTYDQAIGALPVISKMGNTFNGWKDEYGVYYTADTVWQRTSNLMLISDFSPNEYTITYNGNGGTASISTQDVEYGTVVNSLATATKTGYTFTGWNMQADGTGETVNVPYTYEIANDITLYAQYTVNTYVATFDKQGGNGGSAGVNATYNEAMPTATAPTRTGYTFGGYYSQTNGGGTQYYDEDMNSMHVWNYANAATLYAKWVANTYTVTLQVCYPGGANSSLTSQSSSDFKYINYTATESTTITIWTTHTSGDPYLVLYNENLSQLAYNDDGKGNLDSKITYTVTSGVTYVIGFRGYGSRFTKGKVYISKDITATYGSAMPSNAVPTQAGYTFEGYYTAQNGSGTKYYNANMSSANNWNIAGATTLYANWTAHVYTVILNKQSSVLSGTDSVEVTYGSPMPSAEAPTRNNYIFQGYFAETDGAGKQYYDAQMNSINDWDVADGGTIYAYWLGNPYTVTFDQQGGSGGVSSVTARYGAAMPAATAPTRLGYRLVGYFDAPNGAGSKYYDGPNMVSVKNWDKTTDTTLYASWESIEYTITYVYGNAGAVSNPTTYNVETPTFTLTQPVGTPKTGYKYVWDTTQVAQGTTGNLVITALVKPIQYHIYFENMSSANIGIGYPGYFGQYCDYDVSYTLSREWIEPSEGWVFDSWVLTNRQTGAETNVGTGMTYTFKNLSAVEGDRFLIAARYKEEESCVAAGTLITLANGSQVPVESLAGNEMLLVWNLHTGSFDIAPILFIDHDAAAMYKIINLQFSDGTIVKVIDEHAFWDFNLSKYVFLREDAAQYVGHWFNKQTTDANGNMIWTRVQLINVTITEEYTTAWSPVTYGHLCIYVNGMLSMPGATEGLINIFEVDGDTMQIDQEQYLADIATYGLFTYEEFAEIYPIPEMIFEAFGGGYLKVSIGKGLIDYETLGELIERYSEFFE